MSENAEKASRLFGEGCNCCQAVVGSMCEQYGVDNETAMRMGAAFGGGMRRGEVCGAVAGALMTLGLRYGARKADEQDKKAEANDKTIEYMTAFKDRYGSYLCRELIKASGKKVCDTVIPGAVELFEELNK